MKIPFCIFLFAVSLFSSRDISAQDTSIPHFTSENFSQLGLLNIGSSQSWKYQPGDDLNRAAPDFDDSHWHNIIPDGLDIDEMPDSLWNGFGWWRLTFTTDSSFYAGNWTMHFFGWGAAEVYLDGKLVHSFGNFSTNQDQEHTFSPYGQIYPPVRIFEKETHTIAVRYSYHQAKQYNFFMKENGGDLGFNIGFGTHAFNEYTAEINTYVGFTLFVSGAVLFVLLLLHLMLYYKFPEDRANLFLSISFALLLITVLTGFHAVYADVTRYWYIILDLIWTCSVSIAMLFLPYVIASMFKLENLKKVLWLVAGFPLLVIIGFFNLELSGYIALVIMTLSIFFVGYICWRAYREKRKGVHYVALGALATLSVAMFFMLYGISNAQLDFRSYFIMSAFFYILFPLGLTLYVADRYGHLFTSLEKEVDERTYELNQSLENLKATQSQLIQQEKLASLGQLTAGIAHEIKNPLNFVNNFSEVSMELIKEALEEIGQIENNEHASETANILGDIKSNLDKIHEHGTRANSIVSSMLQHSRGGSGKLDPTDLNALIKEYINLSFHGMRAGKNPIDVEIDFDLDSEIKEVPLIKEDFIRVIINLCNNAFDAMRGKKYLVSSIKYQDEAGNDLDYLPKLKVRTSLENGQVRISLADNGPGIPDEIKDKILQPFFTTKKGTEGTGLGLSITHDIVKAHRGDLQVSSTVGEGTEMSIILPLDPK